MTTDPTETRRQELADLLLALSDDPIGPEDKRYFAFHRAQGDPRGMDPVSRLRSPITLTPHRGTCQMFSGFRGTGKSSELRRLRAELEADGFHVVVVEAEKVINLYKPLEPSDLLLSVAAAVALSLEERFGQNPAKRSLGERIVGFFQRVTLAQVELGGSVAAGPATLDLPKLTFDLAKNPSFKAQVQEALRGKLTEFVGAFSSFMVEARDALGGCEDGRCPVLIVDDLEKVTGLGPEQELVQKGMEQIFWEFHWALQVEGWHSIWAAPPYLQLMNSAIKTRYSGNVVLPMVRLWENDEDRTICEDGLAAIRQCMRRRGNVDSLFLNDGAFDRLVMASSGHLRDLMLLMREAVHAAHLQKDTSRPLNEPSVERIIARYRADRQKTIYRRDYDWLREVAETRRLNLDDQDMIPRVAKLLDTAVVITYQNGSEWFDVSSPVRGML